ncbi:hypothetical protein ACFRMQ_06200 [Kitasatospora sp. NPDC056783]|uniref:hypothetical protein n=1 Tax=Kitasatospora sp. NPDC056783 TaxID=3345943 RepID=UPI0036BE64BB
MPDYKLPGDSVLSERFIKGKTDEEIAEEYGCSRQAVNLARNRLKYTRRPYSNRANSLIGAVWRVQTSTGHQDENPIQVLRVWVRLRLGDDSLSARQRTEAINFEARIRREGTVLQYDPSNSKGFSYVQREPQDGRLVVRWPALTSDGVRDPEAEKYLSLPDAPTS